MSYIQNFKKFIKSDEKKTQEMGANPVVAEQDAQATPAEPATTTPQAPTSSSTTVESNPAVVSARTQLANAIANRDKVVAAKQKELTDLTAAQDAIVNNATSTLNNAIATAAKTPTV